MKTTLANARQNLEDALPGLSDWQAREARQVLADAEARAKSYAEEYIAAREAEVRAARDEALRELTAVRDGMDALTSEGSTGRISAEDYSTTLNGLVARQFAAEERLNRAEEKVGLIEQIEADPVARCDSMSQRIPHLLMELPL